MGVNSSLPPISDEDLHSFVDGEADEERSNAILGFLAASPIDAARVETFRRQIETIRAAFARVETEPVPPSVSLPPPARRSKFPCKLLSGKERQSEPRQAQVSARFQFGRKHKQASFLIVAFASGIIATVLASVLIDHIGPSPPERAPLGGDARAPTPAETDDFASRTKAALAAFAPSPATARAANSARNAAVAPSQSALILPNLSSIGLRFAGLRIAPEMPCLFYAKAADLTIALCAERAEGSSAPGFREVGHFPSRAIIWRQGGAKYALAGALSAVELRNLAERVYAEVNGFQAR